MVNFGNKILALQRREWAPYYLDYNGLKKILEEGPPEEGDGENPAELKNTITSSPSHRQDDSQLSFMSKVKAHPGSENFLNQMNLQVEKIVLFFVQEQGRVAYKLVEARQEQAFLMQYLGGELERIHALREKFNDIGKELLELFKYVELNVTGIRKILKKHDKLMYWTASQYYLSGSRRSSDIINPLLHSETMMALCVTLEAAFAELRQREEEVTGILSPNLELPHHVRARSDPAAAHSLINKDPATTTSSSPSITAAEHRRNYSTSQHESFSMFKAAQHPEDAIIARIHVAQRRLKQSSEFVELLAASALVGPDPISRGGSFEEEDLEGPPAISNFLNLMSSFLYMTNYYIIVPTAGSYSEKLGASSSFASMLVGMTPIAALASTLLYSWWTSYSYKSALIFASSCSIIGNIFYLLGIPCHSLNFVLIGRLLNGFGSARSINRRYIADSFSHSERTAASAAFVAAGALGMAAGPGIASILHMAAQNSLSPWWQVENNPGIFMFFVWTTYLVFLIIFFEDPPKRKATAAPAVEMTEEKKQLLGNGDASHKENGELKPLISNGNLNTVKEEPPQWKNPAVFTTFVVYFILKLLLECLLSSTSILTEFYFGWTGSVSGVFMSLMALLMLPANLLVAKLSRKYDDRDLIMSLQAAMLVGCLLIMKYSSKYHVIQYVLGSTAIFLSTNMLEGPNMSLLSKIIPREWSDGFFNVGLLATEAGTLGRAVGDIFLTVCGSGGMEYMLNKTFGSLFVTSFVTFLVSWRYYGILQPAEKDD